MGSPSAETDAATAQQSEAASKARARRLFMVRGEALRCSTTGARTKIGKGMKGSSKLTDRYEVKKKASLPR